MNQWQQEQALKAAEMGYLPQTQADQAAQQFLTQSQGGWGNVIFNPILQVGNKQFNITNTMEQIHIEEHPNPETVFGIFKMEYTKRRRKNWHIKPQIVNVKGVPTQQLF